MTESSWKFHMTEALQSDRASIVGGRGATVNLRRYVLLMLRVRL